VLRRRVDPLLVLAAVGFALSLAGLGGEVAAHGRHVLSWFDLNVYYQSGLLARHDPRLLYQWRAGPEAGFAYTPFAAAIFAELSRIPWPVARWLMAAASIAALVATVWLTTAALGWSRRKQVSSALALSAGMLWLEPVVKALKLGQIELLLMALVVWDVTLPDRSRLKGVGIGLGAGIKLTPLIFIPYLALCGNIRAAVRAAAVFALTILVGAVTLPVPSDTWWLHGHLFHAAHQPNIGSFVNQSLLGFLTRLTGSVSAATPVWLAYAPLVLVAGLATAARLHRLGWTVAGWLACAITGLLVSPISWDHHWVWVVPVLVYGVHLVFNGRREVRRLAVVGTGVVVVIFFGWLRGLIAYRTPDPLPGLLGELRPSRGGRPWSSHGLTAWQLFTWDPFILIGAGLLIVGGMFAFRTGAATSTGARLVRSLSVDAERDHWTPVASRSAENLDE
jgi:alpha-1,2-mannosyltransferase